MLKYVILPPILFLIGAIPTAHLIARRRGVGDLRTTGSKNVGASNIGRLAGRRWGVLTLLIDAVKGGVPILLLRKFGIINEIDTLWAGALLMLGHIYTPFLGWKGGKGLSVLSGILCYLSVWSLFISLVPAFIVYRWSRWVPGLGIVLLISFEVCALVRGLSITTKLAPVIFGVITLVPSLPELIRTPSRFKPPALRDDGSTY